MKIIDVRSRLEIENHIYDANIISITSKKNKAVINNYGSTLFLFFDDIDDEIIDIDINMHPIQKEDARKIANFVNKNKNNDKHFIVNCDAGVSRSAGIAAAIGKYLNNDDTFIFNNNKYCPNMRCYRMVLNELFINEEK